MIPFDSQVMYWIATIRNPLLDSIMLGITYLVDYLVIFLFVMLILFRHERRLAFRIFLTLLIEVTVVVGLKTVFQRPRPTEIPALDRADLYVSSFPSAHASRAFSLAVILSNHYRKIQLTLYALAILVAFSRVYLGVHYFSDVVVGSMIGIGVAGTILHWKISDRIYDWFVPKIRGRKKRKTSKSRRRGKKRAS